MAFAQPYWLVLLVFVPIAGWWSWNATRKRSGMKFSATSAAIMAGPSLRTRLRVLPTVFRVCGLTLAILALARPQDRNVVQERFAEGVDIMMVLDTSTSMRAEDFRPNRFEAAKAVGTEFIQGRTSDRVGLIVFAANAYTQAPLTLDYSFLEKMLAEVEVGVIEDGTAIGTALAMAVNRLKDTEAKSKVVILITDGENNSGQIEPLDAAQLAALESIRVYTVGVGSVGKAKSPVRKRPNGTFIYDWVEVNIDEGTLQRIAQETGGRYFRATSGDKLREVYEEIDMLEKTRFNVFRYNKRTEEFPLIGWLAMLLLGAEAFLRHVIFRSLP
ncbi:MAG TPA: aerotolerance regulator BatA [Bacteroidetes bacterium]|nr:aerotolerance regulator BatA [Bacteroidota bacterium]